MREPVQSGVNVKYINICAKQTLPQKNKGEIELVTFSPRAECNYEECVGQSK